MATKYELSGRDYLEMWKHYQDRADSLKESMFATVAWIMGFAAAVFGFVVSTFVEVGPDGVRAIQAWSGIVMCAIGLLLCLYALALVREFAAHIRRNWSSADTCEEAVQGLRELAGKKPKKDQSDSGRQAARWEIWHSIGGLVGAFAAAFIGLSLCLFLNRT